MNKNQRLLITYGLCTAMVIAGASGCGNEEVTRLNMENETLKAENAGLKKSLASARAEVVALKKAEALEQQTQGSQAITQPAKNGEPHSRPRNQPRNRPM